VLVWCEVNCCFFLEVEVEVEGGLRSHQFIGGAGSRITTRDF